MKNFYMTLGEGQPYHPGYFICVAENEHAAREMTSKVLNGRWCGTYHNFNAVHPADRILKGIIEDGEIVRLMNVVRDLDVTLEDVVFRVEYKHEPNEAIELIAIRYLNPAQSNNDNLLWALSPDIKMRVLRQIEDFEKTYPEDL
jgi:hypothetical protein